MLGTSADVDAASDDVSAAEWGEIRDTNSRNMQASIAKLVKKEITAACGHRSELGEATLGHALSIEAVADAVEAQILPRRRGGDELGEAVTRRAFSQQLRTEVKAMVRDGMKKANCLAASAKANPKRKRRAAPKSPLTENVRRKVQGSTGRRQRARTRRGRRQRARTRRSHRKPKGSTSQRAEGDKSVKTERKPSKEKKKEEEKKEKKKEEEEKKEKKKKEEEKKGKKKKEEEKKGKKKEITTRTSQTRDDTARGGHFSHDCQHLLETGFQGDAKWNPATLPTECNEDMNKCKGKTIEEMRRSYIHQYSRARECHVSLLMGKAAQAPSACKAITPKLKGGSKGCDQALLLKQLDTGRACEDRNKERNWHNFKTCSCPNHKQLPDEDPCKAKGMKLIDIFQFDKEYDGRTPLKLSKVTRP